MNRSIKVFFTIFGLLVFNLLFLTQAAAQAKTQVKTQAKTQIDEKALELARKIYAANAGFLGESSVSELILYNAHNDKIVRKMRSKTVEVKNDGNRSIITFDWPADVKETKLLTWTHRKKDDDQWLYLPSIKRVKRISSRNKTGSFMGSEFSYEDLGSQEVEKYTYASVKDTTLQGRSVWLLERVPVSKNSGYSKQKVFHDKEYMNPVKIEYYDKKAELLKVALFSGYSKIGDFWRAKKIEISNVQTQKKSVLQWSQRDLNQKFSSDDFQSESLVD